MFSIKLEIEGKRGGGGGGGVPGIHEPTLPTPLPEATYTNSPKSDPPKLHPIFIEPRLRLDLRLSKGLFHQDYLSFSEGRKGAYTREDLSQ